MRLIDFTIKLLGLSEAIHRWRDALAKLDVARRADVASYADRIADTLGRAAGAFAALERHPTAIRPARAAVRELGRITGYVEDIVAALEHDLDGRKASPIFAAKSETNTGDRSKSLQKVSGNWTKIMVATAGDHFYPAPC